MSEEEITTTETSLDDFASVFDDWIAGASLTRIPVTIYGRGDLYVEAVSIDQERELLEAELAPLEEHGEETVLSKRSRAAEIRARLDEIEVRHGEIYDEWMDSKSVWIIEDIAEKHAAIKESIGAQPVEPDKPILSLNATDAQKRSHAIKMQNYDSQLAEYNKANVRWHEQYAIATVAAATVRVEFSGGRVVENVTRAMVEKLAKSVGHKQVKRLSEAVAKAMQGEPVINAPLSHTTLPDVQI